MTKEEHEGFQEGGRLIILRHGKYEGDHLTEDGVGQIKVLAKVILQLEFGEAKIFTSLAPRAIETAQLIAGVLGVDPVGIDSREVLGDERGESNAPDGFPDVQRISEMLMGSKNGEIIVVTHGPTVSALIDYLDEVNPFENVLAMNQYGERELPTPKQGQAVLIDLQANTVTLVAGI